MIDSKWQGRPFNLHIPHEQVAGVMRILYITWRRFTLFTLVLKTCICHYNMWQIQLFITWVTISRANQFRQQAIFTRTSRDFRPVSRVLAQQYRGQHWVDAWCFLRHGKEFSGTASYISGWKQLIMVIDRYVMIAHMPCATMGETHPSAPLNYVPKGLMRSI